MCLTKVQRLVRSLRCWKTSKGRTRSEYDGSEEFEVFDSSSTSENAVEIIETTVTASDCESPEWFGCQADSESIAPSKIGHTVRVLSQSERCRDDHNVRDRLRTRRSRAELMLKSETVNPEQVRGEMAKLNPSKATETSLDSTNKDDERPQRRSEKTRAAKCIHKLHRCAQESKGIGQGAEDKQQDEVSIHKVRRNARQLRLLGSFIATHDNVPRIFERPINPNATNVLSQVSRSIVNHLSVLCGMRISAEKRFLTMRVNFLQYIPRSCLRFP